MQQPRVAPALVVNIEASLQQRRDHLLWFQRGIFMETGARRL